MKQSRRPHFRTHFFAALAAIGLWSDGSQATILTFDFGPAANPTIPQSYGDNVVAASMAVDGQTFEYLEGAGFTPNVVVDYVPGSTANPFTLFPSGYGDLMNALGHVQFDVTPDPGFQVVLHSFDVAPWQGGGRLPNIVRVLDADDNVRFDSGTVALAPGASITFPPAPIVSQSPLRIQLFDYGDLGLDNVSFSQQIPEPAGLLLVLCGAIFLASSRVRRRMVTTAVVTLLSILLTLEPAVAGVIQQVYVVVSEQEDVDDVFGVTGDDITRDIRASVSNFSPPPGLPSGGATGAVNQFGALGLSLGGSGVSVTGTTPSAISATVLIGSDEFLNSTGQIQTVVASAIIDGGRLRLIGARNLQIAYQLTVGMIDLGVVPPETDEEETLDDTAFAVGGSASGVLQRAGGVFTAADDGGLSLTTFGGGLAATLDADASTVEIPISVQSFVLGPVHPGGRIHVGYEFDLRITRVFGMNASFDRAFATYSDPLNLSENPAFQISLQPISEPASLALFILGVPILVGRNSLRKTGERIPRPAGGMLSSALVRKQK